MNLSKEFKVGLLAIIAGSMFYFGFRFLKGVDFFTLNKQYYAVYEKVDGLKVSNEVKINGLNVGKVREITILQQQSHRLLVRFDILRDIALNDETVAELSDDGLLGGKVLNLKINKGSRTLNANDTVKTLLNKGMTEMVMSKASPMMSSLDSTIHTVNAILSEYKGMSTQMKLLLANLQQTTANTNGLIADNRGKINEMMTNANQLTASLHENTKKMSPLMNKLNTFADSLNAIKMASTVEKLNGTLANLQKTMNAINDQKGTAGKLIYNDSLYNNLNTLLIDVDKLMVDFKDHPKRYVHFSVFGKKEKAEPKK